MKLGKRKTTQICILEYAEDIGWVFVHREKAEQRRDFVPAASG